MKPDFASTHLDGITNLSLVATVKAGLVPGISESCSYLRRLELALKTLHGIRKASREQFPPGPLTDVVGQLDGVHFFRWTILPPPPLDEDADPDDQFWPVPHRLVLNVTFDGGWEPYMRGIWGPLGSTLDLMLCNCVDYQPARFVSYDDYLAWVRHHELPGGFMYAEGGGSVLDRRYLDRLEAIGRQTRDAVQAQRNAAGFSIRSPEAPPASVAVKASLPALSALFALERFYPDGEDRRYPQHNFLRQASHDILGELWALVSTAQVSPPPMAPPMLQEAWRWFAGPHHPDRDTTAARTIPSDRIQAGILRGFENVTDGALVWLKVTDANLARRSLASLAGQLAPSTASDAQGTVLANVAISWAGLAALDIDRTHLVDFPQEFVEGMAQRAGVLGDVRSNHPSQWKYPLRNWAVDGVNSKPTQRMAPDEMHVVFVLRTGQPDTPAAQAALTAWITNQLQGKPGLRVASVQWGFSNQVPNQPALSREHFGFADGYSQPTLQAAAPATRWSDVVKPGELLVGHANDRGDSDRPWLGELLDHGSFLVVRKIRQHVQRLENVLTQQAALLFGAADATSFVPMLKANLVGREMGGRPLAAAAGTVNDFRYESDPNGIACPFHSHVRRANPRTLPQPGPYSARPPVPRLARRGMSYAGPEAGDCGLVFMAYCGRIADQFEVIQRWLAGGNSSGIGSAMADPLLGVPVPGDTRSYKITLNGEAKTIELGDQPFATLEWGAYLFSPSIAAVEALPSLAALAQPDAAKPAMPQSKAQSPSTPDFEDWRAALEDDNRRPGLWKNIRERLGGERPTPYGRLLGSRRKVMQALQDDGESSSVCGYGHRMEQSIGLGFLGMDAATGHAALAPGVNSVLASIREPEAFAKAFEAAKQLIAMSLAAAPGVPLDLGVLASNVLAQLCKVWFGPTVEPRMPGTPAAPPDQQFSIEDLIAASRYIFSTPQFRQSTNGPDDVRIARGIVGGKRVQAAVKKYLAGTSPDQLTPHAQQIRAALANASIEHGDPGDLFSRTLAGVILGFPPTVMGNLVNTLLEWIPARSRRLWRVQSDWRDERPTAISDLEAARKVIRAPLIETMMRSPLPATVWRTPVAKCPASGHTPDSNRIVVSLYSACQEKDTGHRVMFGGDTDPGSTLYAPHACPGYETAMGVMQGFLAGLIDAGYLEDAGGLRLTIRPG